MNLAFLGCCALALKDGFGPLLPGITFDRAVGLGKSPLAGPIFKPS
jgi:hypothetical protein